MDNISLGFENLSISNDSGINILNNASGYVVKGGVTAILGPSASGKSVLLQVLAGRITEMPINGKVYMNGNVVKPTSKDNPVAYVPQDDSLIGELTSREVTMYTAQLKRNESKETLKEDVDGLLGKLGLSHVADNIIGTLLFRGISGGQKKRAEIAAELIASPSILLLDEPTSGLDSSIAYDVVNTIREIVKASDGKLSTILSIHAPNSKLLSLFDHILLLDQGSTIYFGTVPHALKYFSGIGYECPIGVTPTDYFLKISDSNFKYTQGANFRLLFDESQESIELHQVLRKHFIESVNYDVSKSKWLASTLKNEIEVPFWKQVYLLTYREYALAYRDPTLHYFQVSLMLMFSFFAGAIFFKLPYEVKSNFNIYPGGLLWLILMLCWVHAFKVFHMSKTNKRTKHEVGNKKYSLLAFIVADTFTTATLLALLFPVIPIAYFMMDFPVEAFGYAVLLCWTASLTSEAMLSFITKFSTNPTTSMVFCQLALVLLQQFGSGVFIPWKDTPDYWIWVQESDLFTHSTRSLIMEVMNHMKFRCELLFGNCYDPGTQQQYACASIEDNGLYCDVNGREILYKTQGISNGLSHWNYYGFLCCVFFAYKVFGIFLDYYPVDSIITMIKRLLNRKKALVDTGSSSIEMAVLSKSNIQSADPTDSYVSVDQSVIDIDDANRNIVPDVHPVTLTWTNFSITLPKTGRKLVDNVNGFVKSGSVLALMGPSGAGKTTLLNGLAYRAKYANITGSVMFAGRKMTPNDLTYVPQFDELNPTLTVLEHMLLIGHLTTVDAAEMRERCDKLLDVLGLAVKGGVSVSQLSGGERKRLSVGIGMISNPNVLFLDEPTTGLDSTASFSIVSYLSVIAKTTNVAVILTIHQPSALAFSLLDDLYLLEMGSLVYSGPISTAPEYFKSIGYGNEENDNPADYYLELVQRPPNADQPDITWNSLFAKSSFADKLSKDLAMHTSSKITKGSPPQPSVFRRFYYMLKYFMVYFWKQHGFYYHRLIALIIVAIFLGTLYLNLEKTTDNIANLVGALISMAIGAFLCTISCTSLFAKDRREAVDRVENGLFTPGIFVLTQALASGVYDFALAVVYTSIVYWLIPFNPNRECFIYAILSNWGYFQLMESVLLIAIEIMKNDFLCTTFGMIFLGSSMCFCGFFRAVEDSPVWINWMTYIFPLKWSFDGFVYQLFYTQDFKVSGYSPEVKISGTSILEESFKLTSTKAPGHGWGLWGVLMGYIVMFRFCQYFLFALQTGTLPKLFKKRNNIV